MKKLEKEVLHILKTNARMPAADIGKLVGCSESEADAVVRDLEARGIIVQYSAIINRDKIKNAETVVQALIEVRVRPEKKSGFDKIARQICRYAAVKDHFLISGKFDFLIIVEGRNLEEISRFVSDKLAPIENVLGTSTHFMMKKYKEQGVIIGDLEANDRLAIAP